MVTLSIVLHVFFFNLNGFRNNCTKRTSTPDVTPRVNFKFVDLNNAFSTTHMIFEQKNW
jgi:hypothetical protein